MLSFRKKLMSQFWENLQTHGRTDRRTNGQTLFERTLPAHAGDSKSVGPKMESWETPPLTGYSCEDFPSRTICGHLLPRKGRIRPNNVPEIP